MARQLFRHNAFIEQSGVYLLIGLLALVLLAVDRNTGIFSSTHRLLQQGLLSLHSLFYASNIELGNGFAMLVQRAQLVDRITQLEYERDKLATDFAMTVPQLQQENRQLRDLLNLTANTDESILVAEHIRADSNNPNHLLAINVGTDDFVRLNLPVLSRRGIVGQVTQVFSAYSLVLPIVHRTHALSVQIRGKNSRYIAKGDGQRLVIDKLPLRHDLSVGDQIISTGLGGIYPQFYPVGEVIAVKDAENNLKQAIVDPYADFGDMRFVMVVYQKLVTNNNL